MPSKGNEIFLDGEVNDFAMMLLLHCIEEIVLLI
jgi:hypothetical protein